MKRKASFIALLVACVLLAMVLYLGGQKTAREAEVFRLTLDRHQYDVILSLTPHAEP